MRLYQQLLLFVAVATVIPLVVGFWILRHNESALERRLLAEHQESAARLAEALGRELREVFDRVQRSSEYVSLEGMSSDELGGLLGIVYKQSEDIAQVCLLDEDGRELAPGVFLEAPERFPEYRGRLAVRAEEHREFLERLPWRRAREAPPGSLVLGVARRLSNAEVGLAFVLPLDVGEPPKRWSLGVDLSLRRLHRLAADLGDTRGFVTALFDEEGRLLAGSDMSLTPLSRPAGWPVLHHLATTERGAFFEADSMWAFSRLSLLGWGVALRESADRALAEVRATRGVTLAWTAATILGLVVLGGLFTRRISNNLKRLLWGAREISRGNLGARVTVASSDELAVLAQSFNRMGEDLQASRAEIEAWNRELAQRVEERTRELELAHQRLLETSKLAAIGQLGAGVAHEINNPLVGILGNVQLLLLKPNLPEPLVDTLRKIEAAARRCREVIVNLQHFSEAEPDPEHVPCDIKKVLYDAHSLIEQRLLAAGIATEWNLSENVPPILGDHRQLMQVFFNLFANAKTAMEKGGSLYVSIERRADGGIEVQVRDTGKGIAPEHLSRIFEPFFTTKDEWTNTGLGLSVAYRIVSDHGGRLEVESQPGRGSLFRVVLPAAEAAP
ncbi:MAG: HAMP domain-containing protein [Myxococcales bacterium]|nr:HAMP domain-containing protein [Myxococcales bacterium]